MSLVTSRGPIASESVIPGIRRAKVLKRRTQILHRMPKDALLTTSHREFLDSDDNQTGPTGRGKRSRIRQRIRIGLQDFAYLADPDRFEGRDIDQLWSDDDPPLRNTLAEIIAFMYRVDPDGLEAIVADGIGRGINRVGPAGYEVGEVDIPIEKSGEVLDRARQRMADGEPLSPEQLETLLVQGDVPAEEIREHVQAHGLSPSSSYTHRFR